MFLGFTFCDIPEFWQVTLQDPATSVMEWMVNFYDLLMFTLIIICGVVFTLLFYILMFFSKRDDNFTDNKWFLSSNRFFSHSQYLEIFWTIVPAILLLCISYPSFSLLYALDEPVLPVITISIIGHQWYWTYEYCLGIEKKIVFDSYMVGSKFLKWGESRLLEVDNRLFLPTSLPIRFLITSSDVLHSWAMPSFGIKVDACPGRLTQVSLLIKRIGLYYGQCSEICGINHGFMPIVVQAVIPEIFSILLLNTVTDEI